MLVGLKRHWMRCGLPAPRPWDQDGERRWVCVIHSQYRGQLPFDARREALAAVQTQREARRPASAWIPMVAAGTGRWISVGIGTRVKLVNMRPEYDGTIATIVKVNVTRAVVRLHTAAGRFPQGAEVTAPLRCLERA